MKNLAFLSLGSNIEPEFNLREAVRLLKNFGEVKRVSSVWETHPVSAGPQPNFLNMAVLLETRLDAEQLREQAIVSIEETLGRVRTDDKNSARTIDIDIMLFNDETLSIAHRQIPDPEILERGFVAITLAEIAPDYIHPVTGETLSSIAQKIDPASSGMCRRNDIQIQ